MPYNRLRVTSLRADAHDLGPAMLTLRRNDPAPGVRGLKSWGFDGSLESPGGLPEEADLSATLADGRELSGRGLLKNQRMTFVGDIGASVTYEYLGTGPLAGTDEADYD